MSNAFDKASLVMLPHAYEDGKVYSLKPTDRSGDFTFSRGTGTATRVGEDGYIKKETSNLLLQSNSFDTTWTRTRTSVTSGQNGYDGSSDAWLLECNEGPANVSLQQSLSSSSVVTYSVYAKAGTTNWLNIRTQASGDSVWFDLANGVIGTQKPTTIASKIESVGNDWYRLSIVFDSCTAVRFYVVDGNNNFAVTLGASVYIQDAQLNQGLVAQDYLETTTAPVYGGLTDNMPRLDYSNGSCPALLLEPSRTNLFPHSEYLNALGIKSDSLEMNTADTTSPEGIYNASKFDFASGTRYLGDSIGTLNDVVFSIFAKAGTHDFVQFVSSSTSSFTINFDLANGTSNIIGTLPSGANYDIEDYGNEWYRIWVYYNNNGINASNYWWVVDSLTSSRASNVSTSGNMYFYGLQLEQDATYPTSYIPTYGVSQTRLHDDMTNNLQGLDISSILGVSSYTIFFDVETENTGSSLNVAGNVCAVENPSRRIAIDTRVSVIQDDRSSTTRIKVDVGDNIKHYKGALQVTPTTATIFGNGIKGQSGTSRNLSPNTLYVYNLVYNSDTYKMNKFILFPTALTDSECIELTTIS